MVDFAPERARDLAAWIDGMDGLVFEAHSTDYQTEAALRALVAQHFAILKVGPGLTFALREALFALAAIEDEWLPADERSQLREALEAAMLADPSHWQGHYPGTPDEQRFARAFSLSDRARYYWPVPAGRRRRRPAARQSDAAPAAAAAAEPVSAAPARRDPRRPAHRRAARAGSRACRRGCRAPTPAPAGRHRLIERSLGSARCVPHTPDLPTSRGAAAARKKLGETQSMSDRLREEALEYHRLPVPGKLAVVATKPLATQRDLSLAYSPGVAAACELIVSDPNMAAEMTARANLVAVVTNGTAVLGLGAIGALASKPVMEGKAVLFKKFAGIDSFDIEIDELDPDKLVEVVAALEPTFGAINLEDIKAPECFIVESKLRERMKIPVFHDDQHGTAIIVAAAIRNGLHLVGKPIEHRPAGRQRRRCCGIGLPRPPGQPGHAAAEHPGHRHRGRGLRGPHHADGPVEVALRAADRLRTLAEAIEGADIFLGLSAAGVLKPEMVEKMADRPLIMALANPNPEILPELAKEVRPGLRSSPLAAPTTRTRSTTSCASRSSSGARSTSAPPRSTRR